MVNLFNFNLIRGKVYDKKKLHEKFNGQQQGGMCTPANYPVIFLFDTERGQESGYVDYWTEEGIFEWTGEGAEGNQQYTKGNRALARHVQDSEEVFLFKRKNGRFYEFIDQMVCLDYYWDKGLDKNDKIRDVIKFRLVRMEGLNESLEDQPTQETPDAIIPNKKLRETPVWSRSKKIRDYALNRAGGVCEGCDQKAPFLTQTNRPYLEVHHIRKISDGGPESPKWVAALCPNCHARSHYSKERGLHNQELAEKIEQKERGH